MPNKWCLDHDGTTLRVYSDMVLLLEVPLAELDSTPDVIVCRDPATGKLAFCPAPSTPAAPVGTIPAGSTRGDLLWWDGAAWQLLEPDDVAGHVLTEAGSGDTLTLHWAASPSSAPADADLACGAADQMMLNLATQYDVTADMLRTIINSLATKTLGFLTTELRRWVGTDPLALGVFGNVVVGLLSEISILEPLLTLSFLPPLFAIDQFSLRCAIFSQIGMPDEHGAIMVAAESIDALRAGMPAILTTGAEGPARVLREVQIAVMQYCVGAIPLATWQGWCDVGVGGAVGLCKQCAGYII